MSFLGSVVSIFDRRCILGFLLLSLSLFVVYGDGRGGVSYSLARVLGKVVARHERARHALVETRPAVVRGVNDGVLEATRILEVEVQLALLGVVGLLGPGADVGLELVEAVGDDLFLDGVRF